MILKNWAVITNENKFRWISERIERLYEYLKVITGKTKELEEILKNISAKIDRLYRKFNSNNKLRKKNI